MDGIYKNLGRVSYPIYIKLYQRCGKISLQGLFQTPRLGMFLQLGPVFTGR
ncbi:hypothetical protein EMIT0P294_50090 [Pseudomonas sp. IT-P294]